MDDSDINIMTGEVNASSLLDFFSQLTSKSSSSISNMPIKEEPLTEDDLKALQKDRQKKDNHNLSKTIFATINSNLTDIHFSWEKKKVQHKWQNKRTWNSTSKGEWWVSGTHVAQLHQIKYFYFSDILTWWETWDKIKDQFWRPQWTISGN